MGNKKCFRDIKVKNHEKLIKQDKKNFLGPNEKHNFANPMYYSQIKQFSNKKNLKSGFIKLQNRIGQ